MFRRLSSALPQDPYFPADLEQLGYYINDQDQIRSIINPKQRFHYFISKNRRVLDVQREAMNTCIRANIATRFAALGIETTRLPQTAGPTDPHIPILTSQNLSDAKRVILYFGENEQDLGIFAYRVLGNDNIASGSALDFVSAIQNGKDSESTAVVIANLGQLVWYRRGAKAMTFKTWDALPRKTGVDGPLRFDPVKNRVKGHENEKEHVARVFEMVKQCARKDAAIDVIGVGDGAQEAVSYLNENWDAWKDNVVAMAVGIGSLWRLAEIVKAGEFKQFWGKRTRAYLLHAEPLDAPLMGRGSVHCNCFSSGESLYTECIMPSAFKSMLAFFQLVADLPRYVEIEMEMEKEDEDEDEEASVVGEWISTPSGKPNGGITFSVAGEAKGAEQSTGSES